MSENVVVRFAPSPTGVPHVGNIRTALFDFFFARSMGGKFILRIEDTDQARKIEGAVESIKESLSWLGIEWDELFVQSARLDLYKKYAEELMSKGLAKEENGAIRFVVEKEGKTFWIDQVGSKKIEFLNRDIEDFIILKADGYPTYHLANVVDDHLMNITHVIRGEDWISSTPKHIMLYKAFGWSQPFFVHVPNVLSTDGKKLSKRRGAKSVLDYKKEGILSEALLNYLMLLGWSAKDDREILSKEELISEFSLVKLNDSPAIFDERKLLWMNGEYIRKSQSSKLKTQILELFPQLISLEKFDAYLDLAKSRMKTLLDFKTFVSNVENIELNDTQLAVVKKLKEKYLQIPTLEWKASPISTATISVRDEIGATTKDIYIVLTGVSQGLPFGSKPEIQGKDKTIEWLERIIK